jgi:hypothetical protein
MEDRAMRKLLFLLPAGLALLVWNQADLAVSQPPGSPFDAPAPSSSGLPGGVVPAESSGAGAGPARPANPFPIPPSVVDPWMVCAASYIGPDAPELARQVTLELRNRHNMAAYIFNRADEERVKQRQELDRLKQLYPEAPWRLRTVRIQESCAVLVGPFKDPEKASAALEIIKKLPMPTLQLEEGKSAYDLVNTYEPDPKTKEMIVKRSPVNPFSQALVVRNPAAGPAPRERPKFDPFWKVLNADEEYSLLRCPRPWTLVVKEYYGLRTLVQQQNASESSSFLKLIGLGNQKPGEALGGAAVQAHELARFLRDPKLGFESYVLHTRDRSIVTVGAFQAYNDSDMQRIHRQLTTLKFSPDGRSTQDPIGLMVNPLPMEVPHP